MKPGLVNIALSLANMKLVCLKIVYLDMPALNLYSSNTDLLCLNIMCLNMPALNLYLGNMTLLRPTPDVPRYVST